MKINKKTMLFEDMTDAEATEMLSVARGIVLDGRLPNPTPPWLVEWFEVFGYNESQRMLVLSAAVPPRLLLSVIDWMSKSSGQDGSRALLVKAWKAMQCNKWFPAKPGPDGYSKAVACEAAQEIESFLGMSAEELWEETGLPKSW